MTFWLKRMMLFELNLRCRELLLNRKILLLLSWQIMSGYLAFQGRAMQAYPDLDFDFEPLLEKDEEVPSVEKEAWDLAPFGSTLAPESAEVPTPTAEVLA